jgi:hypothetical protein
MNDRSFDQLLDAWMDLGPTAAPDRVADAARLEARTTHQTALPLWRPPRFLIENTMVRFGLAAAAVVFAALLGYSLLIAPNVGGPSLLPWDRTNEPSGAAIPPVSQLPAAGPIDPGRWAVRDPFPVRVTFEVPEGWVTCNSVGSTEQGVCPEDGFGRGVAFVIVENVLADPCDVTSALDPAVGPSVDDLVAAISGMAGYEASPATDVTVSGYQGKELQITAPLDAGCDLRNWSTGGNRWNGAGPGEVNRMRILDVDGQRVMVATGISPDAVSPAEAAEVEAILNSVEIDAP